MSSLIKRIRSSFSSSSSSSSSINYTPTPHDPSKEFDCVFRYFDKNNDCKISPGELQDCMKAIGQDLSLELAEDLVQSADSDGDGLLCFDEFVTLVDASGYEARQRSSLEEAFEAYEATGEGRITAESLRRALRGLGEARSVEECERMIGKFDENGDGVITFDEFVNMMSLYK